MDTQSGCRGLIPEAAEVWPQPRLSQLPTAFLSPLHLRRCLGKGILASTQLTFPDSKGDGGSTEGDAGEPVA